jgi:hypothetical protein
MLGKASAITSNGSASVIVGKKSLLPQGICEAGTPKAADAKQKN